MRARKARRAAAGCPKCHSRRPPPWRSARSGSPPRARAGERPEVARARARAAIGQHRAACASSALAIASTCVAEKPAWRHRDRGISRAPPPRPRRGPRRPVGWPSSSSSGRLLTIALNPAAAKPRDVLGRDLGGHRGILLVDLLGSCRHSRITSRKASHRPRACARQRPKAGPARRACRAGPSPCRAAPNRGR